MAIVKKYRKKRTMKRGKNIEYTRVRKFSSPQKLVFNGCMPDNMIVKLKYAQTALFTIVSGAPALQVFRANSIYDPDFNVGGHQPLGHDQWAGFYKKYVVIGLRVVARTEATNLANSAKGAQLKQVLVCNTEAAPSYALATYSEQQGAKTNLVSYNTGAKTISGYYSMNKYLGKSKQGYLDEDDNSAIFGTNPANEVYVQHYVGTSDDTTNGSATVIYDLEYIVKLYDKVFLATS